MPKKTSKKTASVAVDFFLANANSLVARLFEDIVSESCVVFVGAGSTTERKSRDVKSFYQEIKEKCNHPISSEASFPEVMQYFCDHLDGGQHNRLIREAVARIERFSIAGDEFRLATIFPNELAELPYFNRFVTTNWDPFLERSLDVMIPIVEDRDLAFWDDRKRQVLKIHGCITRPYSIVATKSDYEACIERNPLIFNKLRDLMATKTFIFTGYSLRDSDFRFVWDSIISSLGRFAKLAYAVDPNATSENTAFWKQRGIELVETTDLQFVRSLRDKLVSEGLIPTLDFLQFLRSERRRITSIHINMGQESDGAFASAMYQDGLLHVLDDILTSTALGTKKGENFERELGEAEKIVSRMIKKKNWIEVAYWSGRREVFARFHARNDTAIPPYFHPYEFKAMHRLVKGRKN